MSMFETEVLPLFEKHRSKWLTDARAVAHKLGKARPFVTIDMVRDIFPPPSDVDPRVMGAVFTKTEWERIGYTSGNRKVSHARPISKFRLRGHFKGSSTN
jgi:hypothetical protein